MEFKMNGNQLTFENEQYLAQMIIKEKGEGKDNRESRLRSAVTIALRVKETQNELNLRVTLYWDTKYPKTHFIFTGSSLVDFINEQGHDYNDFKEFWDKVKRLSSNVFTDDEILNYQKRLAIV